MNPIPAALKKRTRSRLASFALGAWCLLGLLAPAIPAADSGPMAKRIPVIFDSDIGDDIDDTWALGLLLKSPELDLKLAVTDYGKPQYRAKVFAKFLQAAGRAEVPIGLGVPQNPDATGPQAAWIKDYDLARYPGKVHNDGVQALIDKIMNSKETITLIAVGPLPNIAAALQREPRIAERARFVGMHGSVRLGYGGSKEIAPEWNVKADPQACQKTFAAPWDITLTPLDTCGLIQLDGDRYRRLRESTDPIARAILENYRAWSTASDPKNKAAESHSSTLFDTVAVYLAFRQDLCRMERLNLRADDQGFTRIDDKGKAMNVATSWKNLDGFRDLLADRLAGKTR